MNALEATNIAVAGGTLVLAMFTWKAASAAQQAAKAGQLAAEATQQAAQASRDEADATIQLAKEARKDRELAWRPHLGFDATIPNKTGALDAPSLLVQISLSNVGNGPPFPPPSGSTTTTLTGMGGASARTYSWQASRLSHPWGSRWSSLVRNRPVSQNACSTRPLTARIPARGCS